MMRRCEYKEHKRKEEREEKSSPDEGEQEGLYREPPGAGLAEGVGTRGGAVPSVPNIQSAVPSPGRPAC